MNECMSKWMNDLINMWMMSDDSILSHWMNEWLNDWLNEKATNCQKNL